MVLSKSYTATRNAVATESYASTTALWILASSDSLRWSYLSLTRELTPLFGAKASADIGDSKIQTAHKSAREKIIYVLSFFTQETS